MQSVDEQKLREITDRIASELQPEKIILFGSYAWGTPNAESDVDLYIVVASSEEPGYRIARRVYHALRGIGVPVDVIVRSHAEFERNVTVKASLDKAVIEKGIVLYG